MDVLQKTSVQRERGHDFALQRRVTLVKASKSGRLVRLGRAFQGVLHVRLQRPFDFDQEIVRCELLY
jgi:hypothetical protein